MLRSFTLTMWGFFVIQFCDIFSLHPSSIFKTLTCESQKKTLILLIKILTFLA